MAEAERWEEHKQSVFNKSVAWAIPNHYQFVSPEVGFLVFYGHYEYGPADKRFADTSSAFVLLRLPVRRRGRTASQSQPGTLLFLLRKGPGSFYRFAEKVWRNRRFMPRCVYGCRQLW